MPQMMCPDCNGAGIEPAGIEPERSLPPIRMVWKYCRTCDGYRVVRVEPVMTAKRATIPYAKDPA